MDSPGVRGELDLIVRAFRRFRRNLFPANEIADRSSNWPGGSDKSRDSQQPPLGECPQIRGRVRTSAAVYNQAVSQTLLRENFYPTASNRGRAENPHNRREVLQDFPALHSSA